MRQVVVAPDHASYAEGRQERGHHAGAEEAGTALVTDVTAIAAVDVMVAAEQVADEEHHQKEEQPERPDRRIDKHA